MACPSLSGIPGRQVACAIALAALSVPCSPAHAQDAASRFKPLVHAQLSRMARQPLSLQDKQLVRVVVVMDAPSVADARAARPDHRITEQEHQAIHAQVMQQHAAITGAIAGAGGRVLRHYADAVNGMRVEIKRGGIASLARWAHGAGA